MTKAIKKLEARGFKLIRKDGSVLIFKNYSLNRILQYSIENRTFRLYETNTGGAVDIPWRTLEAIVEVFKHFDYRARNDNIVEFIMEKARVDDRTIAAATGLSISTISRINKNGLNNVNEKTIEKIENYAMSLGIVL